VPSPRHLSTLLLLGLLIAWTGSASAQRRDPPRQAVPKERTQQGGTALSEREAAEIVRQRSGGRVLSANPVEEKGRSAYRVKVLTPKGRVRTITIDAHGAAGR